LRNLFFLEVDSFNDLCSLLLCSLTLELTLLLLPSLSLELLLLLDWCRKILVTSFHWALLSELLHTPALLAVLLLFSSKVSLSLLHMIIRVLLLLVQSLSTLILNIKICLLGSL